MSQSHLFLQVIVQSAPGGPPNQPGQTMVRKESTIQQFIFDYQRKKGIPNHRYCFIQNQRIPEHHTFSQYESLLAQYPIIISDQSTLSPQPNQMNPQHAPSQQGFQSVKVDEHVFGHQQPYSPQPHQYQQPFGPQPPEFQSPQYPLPHMPNQQSPNQQQPISQGPPAQPKPVFPQQGPPAGRFHHPALLNASIAGLTNSTAGIKSTPIDETRITDGCFRVFTTATVDSMMKGVDVQIAANMPHDQVHLAVTNHIRDLRKYDGAIKITLFLNGGMEFRHGTIQDWLNVSDTTPTIRHLYALVTTGLSDQLLQAQVLLPCNYSTKEMISLLAPVGGISENALSQIATLLGYLNNNGHRSLDFVASCFRTCPFVPLGVTLYRIAKGFQLNGLHIALATNCLQVLFQSLLPATIPPAKVFDYALRCACFVAHIDASDVEPFLVDAENQRSLQPYYASTSQITSYIRGRQRMPGDRPDPCYLFMPNIIWNGYKMEEMKPASLLAIENIHNHYVTFKPLPPLALRNQFSPCVVQGKDHCLLFKMASASKSSSLGNQVNLLDPKTGLASDRDLEEFTREVGATLGPSTANLIEPDKVQQIIFVCFDSSKSMSWNLDSKSIKPASMVPSRQIIATQYLTTLANKLYAYRTPCIQGLLSFATEVKILSPLSPLVPDFEDGIKQVKPDGTTKLYDAIKHAAEQLIKFNDPAKPTYPKASFRIIVISDGEDYTSTSTPEDVTNLLIQARITLDSIIISNLPDKMGMLIAMCQATGGLAFKPAKIEEGLSLFEQEAFLTLEVRKKPLPSTVAKSVTADYLKEKAEKAELNKCADNAVTIVALRKERLVTPAHAVYDKGHIISADTKAKRIMHNLKIAMNCDDPNIVIRIHHGHFDFWRVFIRVDAADSIYGGKWWFLCIKFPETYPTEPPVFRFISVPYHINISDEGRVCIGPLSKDYQPSIDVIELIIQTKALFLCPNADMPIGIEKRTLFRNNRPEYDRLAQKSTADFAKDDYNEWLQGCPVQEPPANWQNESPMPQVEPHAQISPFTGRVMADPVMLKSGTIVDRNEMCQLLVSTPFVQDPTFGRTQIIIDPFTGQPIIDTYDMVNGYPSYQQPDI